MFKQAHSQSLIPSLFFLCLLTAAQAAIAQSSDLQVEQLNKLLELDPVQQREIQNLLDHSKTKTDKLRMELDEVKRTLTKEIGPGFSETAIRENAEKLGELSGELTAETALLHSRIQDALTEEQRVFLAERIKEAMQMQQQMQQGDSPRKQ